MQRQLTQLLLIRTYNAYTHTYNAVDPLPYSEISRAVFIAMSYLKHAVRFRGRQEFKMRRDLRKYGVHA